MRRLSALLILLSWTYPATCEYTPYLQKFEVWGTLRTSMDKTYFLIGVTNGYFIESHDITLYHCLSDNVSYDQAIAMIDKYYGEHPEKWGDSAAKSVITALTVPGGPCPRPATNQ